MVEALLQFVPFPSRTELYISADNIARGPKSYHLPSPRSDSNNYAECRRSPTSSHLLIRSSSGDAWITTQTDWKCLHTSFWDTTHRSLSLESSVTRFKSSDYSN